MHLRCHKLCLNEYFVAVQVQENANPPLKIISIHLWQYILLLHLFNSILQNVEGVSKKYHILA